MSKKINHINSKNKATTSFDVSIFLMLTVSTWEKKSCSKNEATVFFYVHIYNGLIFLFEVSLALF